MYNEAMIRWRKWVVVAALFMLEFLQIFKMFLLKQLVKIFVNFFSKNRLFASFLL